jgi:hypothetical protein
MLSDLVSVALFFGALSVVLMWVVFPFVVMGKLKEQQKTLDQIEKNTRRD